MSTTRRQAWKLLTFCCHEREMLDTSKVKHKLEKVFALFSRGNSTKQESIPANWFGNLPLITQENCFWKSLLHQKLFVFLCWMCFSRYVSFEKSYFSEVIFWDLEILCDINEEYLQGSSESFPWSFQNNFPPQKTPWPYIISGARIILYHAV